jgi:hypothetical protein
MNFKQFFYESATISQSLKSKKFDANVVAELKSIVRNFLEKAPFFKLEGVKYLDNFVNYFVFNSIKQNAQENILNFVRPVWTTIGDYVAANVHNGQVMSKFNNAEYTAQQAEEDSSIWHEKLGINAGKVGPEGRVVLALDNIGWKNWKWVSLDKPYCKYEGAAAGHCGNAAAKAGDNILSLRDPQNKVHLTFIVNHGVLGESKAPGNEKPSQYYHPAIVALLHSDLVHSVKGGGYAPENNFHLNDLNHETFQQLKKHKKYINNHLDYVFADLGPNPKERLSDLLNTKILDFKNNNEIIIDTADDLNELYDKIHSGWMSNFKWIEDDLDVSHRYNLNDALDYVKNKHKQILESLLDKIKDSGEIKDDIDDWDDIDLEEKIKMVPELEDLIVDSASNALHAGTQAAAYNDLKNQLSETENGFFVNMDTHPYEIGVYLSEIKNHWEDFSYNIDAGETLENMYDFSYKAPHYSFSDFDQKYFDEQLEEGLNYLQKQYA